MGKLKYFLLFAFLFVSYNISSQGLNIELSYMRWENDLNKTSREETYSIYGKTINYTLNYEGKSMPSEVDENKSCEMMAYSYDELIKAINDNKVNRDEYFYRKERNESLFYLKISLNIVLNGVSTSILLEGESNLVMDEKAYLDVIDFIKELRRIAARC